MSPLSKRSPKEYPIGADAMDARCPLCRQRTKLAKGQYDGNWRELNPDGTEHRRACPARKEQAGGRAR
jgi:hypothetical protein